MVDSRLTEFGDGFVGFLNAELVADLDELDAEIAIIGMPRGVDYPNSTPTCATAPDAIRQASARYGYDGMLDHYDFDLGGPMLDSKSVRIVDCGNIIHDPNDPAATPERARAATEAIISRGALPIMLGGDDSTPIPFFRGFEQWGPYTLIQIDAHIDWRDEIHGVHEGYSSTMRRASEMNCIAEMIQIGMRGVGSARAEEVSAAEKYGSKIITASELFELGPEHVLDQIPVGGPYLITIDCDGFDPSIMPGVGAPSPGGLTFGDGMELLRGIAERGMIAGLDVVEYQPDRDVNGITATTAARLISFVIGTVIRSGQIGD